MARWIHGSIAALGILTLGVAGCSSEPSNAPGTSSTAGGGRAGEAGAGGQGGTTAGGGVGGQAGGGGNGGNAGAGQTGGAGQGGAGQGGAGHTGGSAGCERKGGPDDYVRKVVVSHLFDKDAQKSSMYEVLDLSKNGELSKTGQTFEMGRGEQVPIAFTPDGKVGISVQEDGSLGVFRFDDQGQVHVVHERFKGSFYASRVVMGHEGQRAYVLSTQWVVHGGGVYVVRIGCDGTLTDEGKLLEAKMPFGLALLPGAGNIALMASDDVLGSQPSQVGHLIDLEKVTKLDSASVFPDDEAYIGSLALTPDGSLGLFGDTSSFNSIPDRIGVVRIDSGHLTPLQVLEDIEDPMAIEVSPYGNTAMVVSGFGDAIFVLDYDSNNATKPYAFRGKLVYHGDGPKVPGDAVQIARGTLKGLVLVSDYTGIRRVRFTQGSGGIEDLGRFEIGSGTAALTGAVGVQP